MQRVHVTWVQTGEKRKAGLSCIIYMEGFSQAGVWHSAQRWYVKAQLNASGIPNF